LEGSQAVPASTSGKGEACIGDLFNFDFKDVGAAVFRVRTIFEFSSYHPAN
jgi:hypothetical protein